MSNFEVVVNLLPFWEPLLQSLISSAEMTLALHSHNSIFPTQSRQPTRSKNGDLITCAEELGQLWEDFLGNKFSATELELARALYEDIGANTFDPECDLAHEEFMKAVKRMKSGKAVDPDNMPVEI